MARPSKKDQEQQEEVSVEQQEDIKEEAVVVDTKSGFYTRKELPDGTIVETF